MFLNKFSKSITQNLLPGSFMNVEIAKRVGGRDATFTRIFTNNVQSTYFDQVAVGNNLNHSLPSFRAGTDYNFNNKHSVGLILGLTEIVGKGEFLTGTFIGSRPHEPSTFIKADNYSTGTYRNFAANFHYTGKVDSVGTLLTTDLDYVRIQNTGESIFLNYYTDLLSGDSRAESLYTSTPNIFNIYSGKVDITVPVKKEKKIEAGLKFSRVDSDNDYPFYFSNGGVLVPDKKRSNHFKYDESIYSAYINFHGKLSPKLSYQAGLRAEHTTSDGNSITLQHVTKREYTDLFPSVFVQQTASQSLDINYSYSRRVARPNYNQLNPFRAYRDPYTWYEGNTNLRPQYTHSCAITGVLKKTYSLSLSLLIQRDVFNEIPILNVGDTTTVYMFGNLAKGSSLGMTILVPIKLMKKWDSQNTIIGNYNRFETETNLGTVVNDQLFALLQSNHTIFLPKDFRIEVAFLFRTAAASGLYHQAPMHRIDLAVKKKLFNGRIDVAASISDLFKTYPYNWSANFGGQVNEFDQYFRIRSFALSLRYSFSKGLKVEQKRRSNGVEEAARAN